MRRRITNELPHLRRFARGLARDRDLADDLVQDCVERALLKEHLFDPSRRLRPWLFQILRNLFANRGRRSSIESAADWVVDDSGSDEPSAPDDALERLAAKQTLEALQALPTEQREVLLLVCVEELSYRETAEIVGVPIGTVMSRLSRGREALRRRCGEPERVRLRRVK